ANLEPIEKFFFIDATANVSESFITPFGPQPSNLTVPTNNRYISQTYSVSPYVQGVIAPNISYTVRDDNNWTPSASCGDPPATTERFSRRRTIPERSMAAASIGGRRSGLRSKDTGSTGFSARPTAGRQAIGCRTSH